MSETVTLALLVFIGNMFFAGGQIWLNRRKQPAEIKVAEATAARIDAGAGKEYIDNQRRLLTEYSELSLSNSNLQRKFGELEAAFVVLTAKSTQLEKEVKEGVALTTTAETAAREYKSLYEKVQEQVNGFPAQIEDGLRQIKELQAQIRAQRVAAGDAKTVSDQRVSDAASAVQNTMPPPTDTIKSGDTVKVIATPKET